MIEPTWRTDDGSVMLWRGDSLVILPTLPTGIADASATDPPYGVNLAYAGYDDSREALLRLKQGFLPECMRIAPVTAVFSGVTNRDIWSDATWCMAWVKPNGVGVGPWGFMCWTPVHVTVVTHT
jgi:hypothetical protein